MAGPGQEVRTTVTLAVIPSGDCKGGFACLLSVWRMGDSATTEALFPKGIRAGNVSCVRRGTLVAILFGGVIPLVLRSPGPVAVTITVSACCPTFF